MLLLLRHSSNWDKNENCPVAYPRYQMLMDYPEREMQLNQIYIISLSMELYMWESGSTRHSKVQLLCVINADKIVLC